MELKSQFPTTKQLYNLNRAYYVNHFFASSIGYIDLLIETINKLAKYLKTTAYA